MRVFIAVLVLIFSLQSWTKADDISDFEIEGISIGDSLLGHFSVEDILSLGVTDYPNSKKYSRITLKKNTFVTYNDVQFHYLTNNKNFKIASMSGGVYIHNDINKCLKKRDNVVDTVKTLFTNYKIKRADYDHPGDETRKSKVYEVSFVFDSGAEIRISCYDWSEELTKSKYWTDHLKVGVYDPQFIKWIRYEAF